LENVWLESAALIESKRFIDKGDSYLDMYCQFPSSYELATEDVPDDVRERVDGADDEVAPFQMSDLYTRHAWAYGILNQIYKHIHRLPGSSRDFDADYEGDRFYRNKHEKKHYLAKDAARLYCQAGWSMHNAEEDSYYSKVAILVRRVSQIELIAAEACVAQLSGPLHVDDPIHNNLSDNAKLLMDTAEAAVTWYDAALEAIHDLELSEKETDEKVAFLQAELNKTVSDVATSALFTHPHSSDSWQSHFLSQLEERTAALQRTTAEEKMEAGRGAYYLERVREIDPALSPAHHAMRHCWELAVAALTRGRVPSHGGSASPTMEASGQRADAKTVLWQALNYAHLADGLYADAAAYFLRASQAAAAGDAEQERCWRTAAKALMTTSFSVLQRIIQPKYAIDELVTIDEPEIVPTLWARCGEMLSKLSQVDSGKEEASLRRAWIGLTEQFEALEGKTSLLSYQQGKFYAEAIEVVKNFLNTPIDSSTPAESAAPLPAKRIQRYVKLATMAVTLCERLLSISPADFVDEDEVAGYRSKLSGARTTPEERKRASMERAGRLLVDALQSAMGALDGGGSGLKSAEKAYREALRQVEACSAAVV
jgi:hypothetical protein